MSILTQVAPRVQAKSRKPITVEMVITINGQAYEVTPIAPGLDNVKAYRLVKRSTDEQVYDVCQTTAGLVECDCPSYESTYRGNGLETCKHGRALIMVGLVDYPDLVNRDNVTVDKMASVEPTQNHDNVMDLGSPDPRDVYNDAREKLAAIAESEAAVRAEAEGHKYDEITLDSEPPARVAPAFDPEPYDLANVVARGDASWINAGPKGGPTPPCWTPREATGPACCPPSEIQPCTGCVTHDGPADLSDDAWDDSHVWATSDDDAPPARSLAEQVDVEARHYRTLGTPFGDLIAGTLARLADEVRYLDASTPAAYFDRREAALDAAADAAEARMASRCC